ncbi:MAG: hypothetical protein JNM43_19825 [Planctomycetaceae bacterium]|nr:hypothetical protein [Planctomycetaceae bacterium]
MLLSPQSARRKGGRLSTVTELSESRLVLSATPLTQLSELPSDIGFDDALPEPETQGSPSVTVGVDGEIVWDGMLADLDLRDFFGGIDILYPLLPESPLPGDGGDVEESPSVPGDSVDPSGLSDPDPLTLDLGSELSDGDLGQIDGEEALNDTIDTGTPAFESPEIDGGIKISGTLEELLYYLMQDFDFADALLERAAGGEFDQIFPVFSERMGVVTLDTFPNQSAPLEVMISVSPATPIDDTISNAETVIGVSLDELGDWTPGAPFEQANRVQLAAVSAITAIMPDVPFVLSTNIAGAGLLRYVVMDGYGYPMQPMAREGGPILTGEGGTPQDDPGPSPDGIPILSEDPPIPTVEIGGIPGTVKERPPAEPAQEATSSPSLTVLMTAENHSMVLGIPSNDASGLITVESAGVTWRNDVEDNGTSLIIDVPDSVFTGSELHASLVQATLMSPDFWGTRTGWLVRESTRGRLDSVQAQRLLFDQTDMAVWSANEESDGRHESGSNEFASSRRLVRSPIVSDSVSTVLTVRLQPIPYSSQVQLRRYRAGHRQAAAAEYVEIPLREMTAVGQERLEDSAPSQLRYVLNPRAPPRGPPSSECLIETFAENDLLERLRYSIAPRGPSLADSASLSPGSVFFSGPRVSPVFLAV